MYKALYLLYGVIVFSSCGMNAMDVDSKKVGVGGVGNNSVSSIKTNKAEKKLASSPYKCPSSGGNHRFPFKGNINNKRDVLSEH